MRKRGRPYKKDSRNILANLLRKSYKEWKKEREEKRGKNANLGAGERGGK